LESRPLHVSRMATAAGVAAAAGDLSHVEGGHPVVPARSQPGDAGPRRPGPGVEGTSTVGGLGQVRVAGTHDVGRELVVEAVVGEVLPVAPAEEEELAAGVVAVLEQPQG